MGSGVDGDAAGFVLIGILWLVVITFIGLFSAVNLIYEDSAAYHGVSIQSYLDLGKLLTIVIGVILTASQITGRSPVVLFVVLVRSRRF